MKTYWVEYTASYMVEANNRDEAIEAAIELHGDLPNGVWFAEEEN